MEKYRAPAQLAIGRAVLFGGFAISMVMLSFAFDFTLALRAGAILTLGMTAVLIWFAQTAHRRRPERCEVWLLIADRERPQSEIARRIFQDIMCETYLFYAVRAYAVAVGLLALGIVLAMSGLRIGLL
jgi:hypothetical protein